MDTNARDLIEQDPEAFALAMYERMPRPEADAAEVREPGPVLETTPGLGARAAFACGRGIRFVLYCVLAFARPFVHFACTGVALVGGLGVLVLLVVYQADWTKTLTAAGFGVGAVAARALYDSILDAVTPNDY